MKVKDEIFNTLRRNSKLKRMISDKIGTEVQNVYNWCARKQHKKVGHPIVTKILRRELHITDAEIFETLNT